jgi:hypothetical protein
MTSVIDDHEQPPAHTLPSRARALKIVSFGLVLWLLPLLGLIAWRGWGSLHVQEYRFFTLAALVTSDRRTHRSTAAVVGVVLNLALVFGAAVIWPHEFTGGTDWFAAAISFSPEALYILENYPWPGNIRELENAVVRAVALCSGVVHPEDLPDHIRGYQTTLSEVVPEQDTDAEQRHDDRWLTLSEMEARYIKRVLNHTKGNKQAASRLLNIDPKTIERMIRRYDIEIEYGIKIR